MKNLIFFDKEGNPLNFSYNENIERHEGDILFPEASSDTFKTQSLYLFERIEPFEYENNPDLSLRKFQLFNEYGFHFYPGVATHSVVKIEPVNQESDYYSKWIYGRNFEAKFKLGTFIRFNNPIFEFNDPNRLYVVVSSKKDAILILSLMQNDIFESTYGGLYNLSSSYVDVTISGIDIIGIYNYITPALRNTLSLWNEPDFYDRLYQFRKLNIVNTQKNDSYRLTGRYDDVDVVTIKNANIADIVHYEFNVSSIPQDSVLFIEVVTKTDLPRIYRGPINFDSSLKRLEFEDPIPSILKVGIEFKVPNSSLNSQYFYKVDNIPTFLGNVNEIYYATGSQVLWNNEIYQCIQAYTWSGGASESIILPTGESISEFYWSQPTYLPIVPSSSSGTIVNESMVGGEIYLTTDRLYFTQSYTQSSIITLASAAEKFKDELRILNIDLYYSDNALRADLIYPTRYALANFYHTQVGPTYSIGSQKIVYEKCIETYEPLIREFNYDISSNYDYNIVFTDIDEFGIIIKINKMVYGERIAWIYSSGLVDMQRTIDRTLRNWLTRYFTILNTLGILPSLTTVGYTSVYYNSINLRTEFPNVPLEFTVQVGTTADYYIEHTVVSFNDMGKFLSVNINGRTYEEIFDTDIPTTLANWTENWTETINDFGIFVSNAASALKFNVKRQIQRVDLNINIGKSSLPGIDNFNIIKKFSGNHGALITSNEIILATQSASLEEVGFATGQVIGINRTFYPLQNIEFNSLYLNPDTINLSYEGPFWGLTDSICNSSAFTTVAFTIGFGQTGCPPAFSPDLLRGMYDNFQYATDFSIEYIFSNNYIPYTYDGVAGMVDLVHVEPVNSIYVFGDLIRVFDSNYAGVLTDITISGLTNSIELCFNYISNYLFALSRNTLYKIDPYINQLIASYSLSNNAHSIQLNSDNGDIYVSYENATQIDVFTITSTTPTTVSTPYNTYKMVYNNFEQDMYVVTDGDYVLRIDGSSRTIQASYSIVGLTGSIELDPENEAVYIFGFSNPYKIDNGIVATVSSVGTGNFGALLFNNFNSSMNFSTDIAFSSVFVDDNSLLYSNTPIDYGNIALNQFDGDMYIAGQSGQILVIDTNSGLTKNTESFAVGAITQIIYNPDRRSIWAIQPATEQVIEVQVSLSSFFTLDTVSSTSSTDNFFGTLSEEYENRDYLWLNVREYIRRPRENFNGSPTVSLYWRWFSDNVPQFFMYDFSGNQLPTSGLLAYNGPKPLPTVVLNRKSNRDISKISTPEYQQTIFDVIEEKLDFIDDNFDVSIIPEPIQLFLGYNSPDEGALRSILQLYKKEDVDFTITTTAINNDVITIETVFDTFTGDVYGKISLKDDSSSFFTADIFGNLRGLKVDQHLAIFIKDVTNNRSQYISNNNGYLVKIRSIFARELIVDFFKDVDRFDTETSISNNFPKIGQTTYLSFRFKVWDKEIGRFNVYAQTEIEDIRYHIELNNVGKLVSSDDVYIFKEYDIKEEGIDWNYLNAKRKEMLMMKNLIFPYIGSYKSIINAINYFGYNDLELNEYYRNVDINSENYQKLFKVEIPDIFDNTVEGWKENDFIKNTFPNDKFEDTNLFNLTYRITDKEGNNILYYTLEEVQKKLQGLKYWLQKNIIPITHKILDITGRADFVGGTTLVHQSRDIQIIKVKQDFTPVIFDLNEAYLLPVNNGSTVYNCVLDFYIVGSPTSSLLPDSYTVDIRTYEIYREWYAFKNYSIGERVVYFGRLYESVVSNNKTNNPRKFENADEWIFGTFYEVSDIVKYDRLIYIYTGQDGATSSVISPVLDQGVGFNWLDITEWKEVDLVPVEKISEWRPITNINPFNFTIDSNITPYIVVEVTSSNGYGGVYRDRKNFEIKGILDIQELEAFSNLTTKQYRAATQPAVYVDVSKVAELTMLALPFTSGFSTNQPYLGPLNQVVYPNIQHGYPYIIGNSSSFSVSSFRIELSGDYIYLDNHYVVTDSGNAYLSGTDLYWNGNLSPGSTVSVELRADVTKGGKAYWIDSPNTPNNQALVPVTYSITSKLATGQNYGFTQSTVANVTTTYWQIYNKTVPNSPPAPLFDGLDWSLIYGSSIIKFEFATFSTGGLDVFTSSQKFENNFETVSEGFNQIIGKLGYVYYQARRPGTNNVRPYILLSTYYDFTSPSSSINFYANSGSGDILNTGFSDYTIAIDTPGFNYGTNSTIGSVTITQSYYP